MALSMHRWRMTPEGEIWPGLGVTGRCRDCEGLWTRERAVEPCPGEVVLQPVFPPDGCEAGAVLGMLDRDGRPHARRWSGGHWQDRKGNLSTPQELGRRGLVCWGEIRRRDAAFEGMLASSPFPGLTSPGRSAG